MRQCLKVLVTSLLVMGMLLVLFLMSDALGLLLFIILPILLVSGLATYLTSVACRLAWQRRWLLGWHVGLIGALVAGGIAGCVVWSGLSLQLGDWGKLDLRPLFFWMCVSGSAFGVLPSALVVRHYRKKIKNDGHFV